MVTDAPPLTAIFLTAFSVAERKAMDPLSGENTGDHGCRLCCMPGMGLASRSDIGRRNNWLPDDPGMLAT